MRPRANDLRLRHVRLPVAAMLLCAASSVAHAGLHSGNEYNALAALYSASNGAAWTQHDNWLAGDACAWYGVTCDQDMSPADDSSHITRLRLNGNNLSGSIAALSGLVHLQEFNVGNNALTGPLPDINSLAELQYFYAYDNQLSGTLSSLGTLPLVTVFDVEDNLLSGPFPSSVPAWPSLTTLRLSNNAFDGALPDLSGMNELSYLQISKNGFRGRIPALPPHLGSFFVAYNRFTGPLPPAPPSLSSANLCPNFFEAIPHADDAAWEAATGNSPWWTSPVASACDGIFFDDLER